LDNLVPTPVVIAINPKPIDVHHSLKVSVYYPKGVIRRYKRPVVITAPPLKALRVIPEHRPRPQCCLAQLSTQRSSSP
jgi:hypothetical protein